VQLLGDDLARGAACLRQPATAQIAQMMKEEE